jgi:uncharacterized BrkB/YihY/UPF0761 family membrane protein
MKQLISQNQALRVLLSHLPLLGVLSILAFFAMVDTPVLEQYRSEELFAWMLIVWTPLGILLTLVQIFIWGRWLARRATPQWRKAVMVGFLLALTTFFFFLTLRYLS